MPFYIGDTFGGLQGAAQRGASMEAENYFKLAQMNQQEEARAFAEQQAAAKAQQDAQDSARQWQWTQRQDLLNRAASNRSADLEEAKFNLTKSRETPTGFREQQAAEAKADQERMAGILAGHLNAKQELEGQIFKLNDLAALYPDAQKKESGLFTGAETAKSRAVEALRPRFPAGFDFPAGAGDFPVQVTAAKTRLQPKLDTLDFIIGNAIKQGGIDLITQDKNGKWVPAVKGKSFQLSGLGNDAAAPNALAAPLPMPASKAQLVTGSTYRTPRGLAVWDGEKFTAQ